jgi:cysteinyl-tRNA synthetase
VRLLFFQTHYRQPVDFTDEALDAAKEGVRRLGEFHERLTRAAARGQNDGPLATLADAMEADVTAALNDDLNAPRAVAALFDFVRATNRELDRPQGAGGTARPLAAFERVAGVLDLLPTQRSADPALASWVAERIAARTQARKSKDFKAADAIRAELAARGVEIEDTPQGTKWRMA